MTPEIRDFHCSDIEGIEHWLPEYSDDVDFWLTVMIGIDEHGGDNFDIHVVSPKNLKHGKESKKYSIVMTSYSWQGLVKEIDAILKECKGHNWQDISKQLSKHFLWEYENMVPPYVR